MKQTTTSIKGVVVPAEWETDGRVAAVDIAGYDEKKYRVAAGQIGSQLFRFIKQRIVAEGIVQSGKRWDTIHVDQYRLDMFDE